jgi:NarL family two-component system response regulator YdfI
VRRVFLIAPAGRSRERLEVLLDSAGAEVVGRGDDLESADEEAVEGIDIVLVEAGGGRLDELLETLQETGLLRSTHVVLLADEAAPVWVNQAVRAGVRAILPVEVNAKQVGAALEAVSQDLVVLHPREVQTARTSRSVASEVLENVESLTSREREVLQLLAHGLGNKEIAARMRISEHTVKFHVASILGKLGASTRTEAVSIALQRGLILI